jgi:hypothetical protein
MLSLSPIFSSSLDRRSNGRPHFDGLLLYTCLSHKVYLSCDFLLSTDTQIRENLTISISVRWGGVNFKLPVTGTGAALFQNQFDECLPPICLPSNTVTTEISVSALLPFNHPFISTIGFYSVSMGESYPTSFW